MDLTTSNQLHRSGAPDYSVDAIGAFLSRPALMKLLKPKVHAAWRVLEGGHARDLSPEEIDHLLALYVLGLTTPFYGSGDAMAHYTACLDLLDTVMPDGQADRVLRAVPAISGSRMASAVVSVEKFGLRDGRALLEGSASKSMENQLNIEGQPDRGSGVGVGL